MRLFPMLFALIPCLAVAQVKPPTGVDVALISENTAIAAGKIFTVALKIHHHEKFHTYWQNPGIAGVPTEIKWQLPEGFSASPIRWPHPEKILMAGHPVHGYERDVMLLADITPPSEILAGEVRLKATATWMACADGCYPGTTDLELVIPVSSQPTKNQAISESFETASREIPQPLVGWTTELISAVDAAEIRIRLMPKSPGTTLPPDLYFFSADGQISSDLPQRIETHEDGSVALTATRSLYGPRGKLTLPGVLYSTATLGKSGLHHASIEPTAKP